MGKVKMNLGLSLLKMNRDGHICLNSAYEEYDDDVFGKKVEHYQHERYSEVDARGKVSDDLFYKNRKSVMEHSIRVLGCISTF